MRSLFVTTGKSWVAGLVVAAAFLLGASSASAISLALAGANGQLVAVGDQVTITVTLDTEGQTGITLLSTGVIFDDAILTYNSGASSATSYILYQAGKAGGPYMTAAADPPELRFGTSDQVNVDFTATDLVNGTGPATGNSAAGGGLIPGGLLATLVFDVTGLGDGVADIYLSITSPGNVLAFGGGATATPTLAGAGTVITPEPTTALLVGLGLLGLGVAGKRRA